MYAGELVRVTFVLGLGRLDGVAAVVGAAVVDGATVAGRSTASVGSTAVGAGSTVAGSLVTEGSAVADRVGAALVGGATTTGAIVLGDDSGAAGTYAGPRLGVCRIVSAASPATAAIAAAITSPRADMCRINRRYAAFARTGGTLVQRPERRL